MKNINYKLINYTLISIIIFLIVLSRDFWLSAITQIFSIIIPFIVAFALAYAAYPFLKWLESKRLPKWLGVVIIVLLFTGSLTLIISLLIPLVYEQTLQLVKSIIEYINELSYKNNWDLNYLINTFTNIDKIISEASKFVTNSAFGIVSVIISFFTTSVITFFSFIYFLIDMDKIREHIKAFFKKNKKRYEYVKSLDRGIKNYLIGTSKFIMIQMLEYPLCFYLIGHPYFLILGILASFTSIIPIFGGMIVGMIALITALVVSPNLFWATLIVVLIFSNIDGYFWSPKIYKETNNIPSLLIIFGVFAGGMLLGFWGIVLSLPVTIIISESVKYLKNKN